MNQSINGFRLIDDRIKKKKGVTELLQSMGTEPIPNLTVKLSWSRGMILL
jgi:hypothetical protein